MHRVPRLSRSLSPVPARALTALACLALAGAAGPAAAGRAMLFSYNGGGFIPPDQTNQVGTGRTTVQASTSAFFGQANAYEFLGGIGVSAFATSRGLNMQAQAFASFSQSMTAVCPLDDAAGDLLAGCILPISIVADGQTSASGNPNSNNPTVFGTAQASYNFRWTISGRGINIEGSAVVDQRSLDNGTHTLDITGNPLGGVHEVVVNNGERITITLQAGAGAFTDNNGDGMASAVADFSHTLRWGGVQGARGVNGQVLAAGAVQLLGDDGFDYMNAAPPNPFTSPVPEPATALLWTLGGALWLLRRRARPAGPAACADGAAA